MNDVVIVSAARTPIASLQGKLTSLSCAQLGGIAIGAAVQRSGIDVNLIDEVLMGCVLPAGQGQAPARQAALNAGLAYSVPCTTINKMCGSGMKAVMLAYDLLNAGSCNTIVAGGMESMSNAPYLLPRVRTGLHMGHGAVLDHMFVDGLEDAYDKGTLMGGFAELCASSYQFSRQAQDDYAIESLRRSRLATEQGWFDWEIEPVAIKTKQVNKLVKHDEQIEHANEEKIPRLKPAFKADGTVTAANSSSISDGAAALVLMQRDHAEQHGIRPLARILAHSSYAQQPALFTTAPSKAITKVLHKCNWAIETVDLFEINEAFAVVAMAALHDLKLPHDKVNIHGGACALGHPIGASGTRIIATLMGALKRTKGKRGVASVCIGGGEATAVAIEMES
jgi:acetyl-CoA C-acetyltransferase